MILVQTELKSSIIHGIGIFAKEFIAKGIRVWEFKNGFDMILSKEQIDGLSVSARMQVLNYAYTSKKTGMYVLCADDSRFFNHSPNANTVCVYNSMSGSDENLICYAVRNIQPGEEMTNNYEEFDADPSDVI